jgi:plasmid stabilization system protein ParE
MASKPAIVKFSANFEANLGQIEAFLARENAMQAYDALLAELAATVIPNLERFPQMGRLFFSRGAGSVEAHAKIERLALRIGDGELREYLSGDYLLLYALMKGTVYLLSIKHHRQLSFDFERLWMDGR